ncbi:hypothetical protein [Texcoconibacillus texcoconensis]|uniref:Uncharacterized protein n=1 Tax=Texcoconibacillus texcoconensis TaxID=1095777 RepID=A0A840QQD9_9BACI|nr:hypothetical protein [Texcoconibacillus texcoconensis]MBB5173652.1 hypothetical protein [Texcoconibacillus texcoconensis]
MTQQVDTNSLKKAEAASAVAKDALTQAIEQSAADPTRAEEALKQASQELLQCQGLVSQVQNGMQEQNQQQ